MKIIMITPPLKSCSEDQEDTVCENELGASNPPGKNHLMNHLGFQTPFRYEKTEVRSYITRPYAFSVLNTGPWQAAPSLPCLFHSLLFPEDLLLFTSLENGGRMLVHGYSLTCVFCPYHIDSTCRYLCQKHAIASLSKDFILILI